MLERVEIKVKERESGPKKHFRGVVRRRESEGKKKKSRMLKRVETQVK